MGKMPVLLPAAGAASGRASQSHLQLTWSADWELGLAAGN